MLQQKLQCLKKILSKGGPSLVAFSGGVDSCLLLHVAVEVLGNRVVALTAASPSMPGKALEHAASFARRFAIEHLVVNSKEVEDPNYIKNPTNRCFFCKDELYSLCEKVREERGLKFVYDGTILDDLSEHRPGLKAQEKHGVRSPLVEAEFTKLDIRELSKGFNIDGWERPASPCLSSRFPVGISISPERLKMVEEFEDFLHSLGFVECRVRFYESLAKIEFDRDLISKSFSSPYRELILDKGKLLGFKHVAIDIDGYRRGSLTNHLVNIEIEGI